MREKAKRASRWVSYAVAVACGVWLGIHVHAFFDVLSATAHSR